MSNLLVELGLRLAKVAVAVLLGWLLYVLLTGPLHAPGSIELAVLSFLAGAATILLVENGVV